jgi:hypothetical protein
MSYLMGIGCEHRHNTGRSPCDFHPVNASWIVLDRMQRSNCSVTLSRDPSKIAFGIATSINRP